MKDKGDGRRWRQKETSHHDADLTPEKGVGKGRSGADERQHYPETISARLTGVLNQSRPFLVSDMKQEWPVWPGSSTPQWSVIGEAQPGEPWLLCERGAAGCTSAQLCSLQKVLWKADQSEALLRPPHQLCLLCQQM